jgi:hypothetical protein
VIAKVETVLDRAVREEAAHAAVLVLRREKRTQEVRLARLFRTIDKSCAFVYHACASVAEYGARFGYSPKEAADLAAVGAALEIAPAMEESLLSGRLTFDAAAAVARLLVRPEFAGQHGAWVRLAESTDFAELKRRIRKALAEAERREPVVPKTVMLTEGDEKDFLDARGLASKREGRPLSEGETIGVLSRHYLETFDPLRAKPGRRRVPDTATVDSRYVPVAVRRAVWARTGGRCAVWGCPNRKGLQFAHLDPHRAGGDREADNIVLLCGLCRYRHNPHYADFGIMPRWRPARAWGGVSARHNQMAWRKARRGSDGR